MYSYTGIGVDGRRRRRGTLTHSRYTLLRGFRIVFEDAPVAAPIRALAALAAGAATGPLLVLATERFIATALEVAAGALPFAAVAAPVLLLLALFAVQILETAVRGLADARIETGLRRGFRTDLTEKRARLEYRYLEHPETADLLRRVASGPQQESQPTPEQGPVKQAFDDYVGLLSVAVRVVGIALVLARLGWWIVPAVLVVTVPFVLLGIRSGQRVYELERRVSRQRRRANYLAEEVLQGRDAAAERALFGFSSYVKTRWRSVFEAVVKLEMLWNVRIWVRFKSAGGVAIAGIIVAMLAFLRPLQAGVIDVAFYVAAVMALMQAERVVAQELVQITSRLARHREFLGDLSALSALPETPRALTRRPPRQAFEALEFAGVSFAYPGAEEPVLTDVSFTLERGRHYALVGANGAGKSTITRLMLGLYRPGGGRIEINGTPIGDWPQEELNGLFGVVFQDFARYALTVRDNVTLGMTLGLPARDGGELVGASLRRAGLDEAVAGLPRGTDTPLGKVLPGGVDLSGGQWQRLALARSLAGAAPVRILDEPTAALDPLAESEVYRSYSQVAAGLTTLFISHRLGSTKIADRILVLDGGEIAETGTHDELMRLAGRYARMFTTQRHWYETA